MTHLVNALLMCSKEKTLTNLFWHIAGDPDSKTAAVFSGEHLGSGGGIQHRQAVHGVVAPGRRQHIAFDRPVADRRRRSLGEKDRPTRRLEAGDFHHNHTEGRSKKPKFANGFVYVEVHLHLGLIGCTFDLHWYLCGKTVRRLNLQRDATHRLHYRSKYGLARKMLVELQALLPKGYPVYVLFDSWYASAKLIKFCRRQGWHMICALKSNRRMDKKRIDQHDLALKHQHYQRVTLAAVDLHRPAPRYYMCSVKGRLEEVPGPICAMISRRHPGDKCPKFFACPTSHCRWSKPYAITKSAGQWRSVPSI